MRAGVRFSKVKLMIASPERILQWSRGEVKRAESINYRTLKPERDGLFCERIFGTTKEWECACGKFKGYRYRGVVCDRCGVEVNHFKVRRERMGHIKLAAPVVHIWFMKAGGSKLGLLLNITSKDLEKVVYYEGLQLLTSLFGWDVKIGSILPGDVVSKLRTVFKMGEAERTLESLSEQLLEAGKKVVDPLLKLFKSFEKDWTEFKNKLDKLVSSLPEAVAKALAEKQGILPKDTLESYLEIDNKALHSWLLKLRSYQEEVQHFNGELSKIENILNSFLVSRELEETMEKIGLKEELKQVKDSIEVLRGRVTLLINRFGSFLEGNIDTKGLAEIEAQLKEVGGTAHALVTGNGAIKALLALMAPYKEFIKFINEEVRPSIRKEPEGFRVIGVVTAREDRIFLDDEAAGYAINTGAEKLSSLLGEDYSLGWMMGAEGVKEILSRMDLDGLATSLRREMKEKAKANKKRLLKRLEIVEAFRNSGNKPEWMVLEVLPVIPPDLRPMIQLDGGRFASSDLNDLYRRVINRNNRLRRLIELKAPEIIIRNEKRMLQEAVDSLLDNEKSNHPVLGTRNRPLKSLADILKGKRGRFRQNLLGKRVDYSGRAVIVVGPELKMYQCGVPKEMALELFKPFIIFHLTRRREDLTIKAAKRMVERGEPVVWEILESVVREHPVLLNRAPTLHRPSIQAFEPVLVEGKAIQLHPLVCTPYNADFDGDQMAIHVPLSPEAQAESWLLMLSVHNIMSPASGRPLTVPTQDMVLGLFYLTQEKPGAKGEGMAFSSAFEAIYAYETGVVDLHARIKVKIDGKLVDTTVGRLIFNDIVPKELGFVNEVVDKKLAADLVARSFKKLGTYKTAKFLDDMKALGFYYSTKFGATISIEDLLIPEEKANIIKEALAEEHNIYSDFKAGKITNQERYNQLIDLWTRVTDEITDLLKEKLRDDRQGFNPVYMMAISGARGRWDQVRQLSGMRGLMAKPSGEIIELPIVSNFKEGLSVLEYFISTHGARKGLADTALKTADAGYLTRRLVDVAQDVIVTEDDCGTVRGIRMRAIKEGDEVIVSLRDRIAGRVSLDDIYHPKTGELLVAANELIDEETARKIEEAGIEEVRIRSVLTCQAKHGVCAKCYGQDFSTGRLVEVGEAVGVIAAQSIGEPGTQLTMRTFHIGGTAFLQAEEREIKFPTYVLITGVPSTAIKRKEGDRTFWIIPRRSALIIRRVLEKYDLNEFELQITPNSKVVKGTKLGKLKGEIVESSVEGEAIVKDNWLLIVAPPSRVNLRPGTILHFGEGTLVEPGYVIAEFDPYNDPVITEHSGVVELKDIVPGRTIREEFEEETGTYRKVVVEYHAEKLHPRVVIKQNDQEVAEYVLPFGAYLLVDDGDKVEAGDLLAKIPREAGKTKDITGGLPRVVELFEARHPKDAAVIAEIDGEVVVHPPEKGIRKIEVRGEAETRTYEVPVGKYLRVQTGDHVAAGEPLVEGPVDPHDILRVLGLEALQEFLVNQIQEVYRLQGVAINDKHFEIIIRQMVKKVEVEDPGDSNYLIGQLVDRVEYEEVNAKLREEGKRPVKVKPVLLGITRAALASGSWISSASFQETTRVLTDAALKGKEDQLRGLKENVIIGHLIPAGTGVIDYDATELEEHVPEGMEEFLELATSSEEVELSEEDLKEATGQVGIDSEEMDFFETT